MCILCERSTLEILTAPLEHLPPGQVAAAIRTARDAAAAGVLDYAESVLREEIPPTVDAELYDEIVVSRARDEGVLSRSEASGWVARLRTDVAAQDPRVLAFVSSCAEIVDEYRLVFAERRQTLERFLEVRPGTVHFASIGQDGELWFENRGELLAVLAEDEALEIVERELNLTLHSTPPEALLKYTTLPDTALEVLTGIQAKSAEVANSILAGLIDLGAMADDRVRSEGFAPFFRAEGEHTVEDLRFGEWVVIRTSADE
jgi:hypothetical protein